MNVKKMKQLFRKLAQELPGPGMPEGGTAPGGQILKGPMVIRGGMILREELALAYLETLEKMYDVAASDSTWNKDAIDDLFAKHLVAVAKAEASQRSAEVQTQATEFAAALGSTPASWVVDLSVFGMSGDCAGLTFGRLAFVIDDVRSPVAIPGLLNPGVDTSFLFVKVTVQAINRKAAYERARDIVDQHLAVLNTLCSDLVPSRTHLAHRAAPLRRFAISRVVQAGEENPELRLNTENPAVLLSRADYDAFLKRRGGARMSALLLQDHSFGKRLVSGYEVAGIASVELKAHLSFLLFAIALESVVLGRQTQTEITYQLSARVAHLIAADVPSRRTLAKTVNELYSLRSKIVHTGESDVSEAQLEAIREICLNTLFALAILSPFANMKKIEELEEWFKDRLLGASDSPEGNEKA